MRKPLILAALAITVVFVAASVYYHFMLQADPTPDIELKPEQRAHLQAEATRLFNARGSIDQPDAAWVADRLPEDPGAEDLARLGHERLQWLKDEQDRRMYREYPQLWDAWGDRAVRLQDTGGTDKLFKAGELLKPLYTDPGAYRGLLNSGEELSPQTRQSFLSETETATALVAEALAAGHLVWIPPRVERLSDEIPMPAGYAVFRVLPFRIMELARAGKLQQAISELDVLMTAFSRVDWSLSLLGNLMHVINSDMLLENAVLPLIEGYAVPAASARKWLQLAAQARHDTTYALAVDSVVSARWSMHEPGLDFVAQLTGDAPAPVEDCFSVWHRHNDWRFDFYAYVVSDRPSLLTAEGQQRAAHALQKAPFLTYGQLRDELEARLKWAALDLRIAELEHGPLTKDRKLVDEVLARWPALSPEWRQDTLLVWVKAEYRFGAKASKPLIELAPRK